MAGYRVQEIPSNARGDMDLDALRLAATPDLAGLMITLPSTLGLFDPSIAEICDVVHAAGGVVYGDGANMNALLGQVKLGALGFDIVHLNLHKTLLIPYSPITTHDQEILRSVSWDTMDYSQTKGK